MRPLTRREIKSMRYRGPKPRETRTRKLRIQRYIVYSPWAITRDFREPRWFNTQLEAWEHAHHIRNCGWDYILEVINQEVELKATRFQFPGVLHPTMRTSSVGLCAID
jgi:hypothetical protein